MSNDPINSYANYTDRQLAVAAQEDDLDAFETLVRRHQNALICFLRYYSRSCSDIEDAAQEAFLKCFVNIHQFDTRHNFRTWLYTIARRSFARKKTLPTAATANSETSLLAGNETEAVTHAESAEARQGLWQIVRRFTNDDEFHLVWLRYAEGFSYAEIATFFHESTAACKMRLSRIRKRLKPDLQPFLQENFTQMPSHLIHNLGFVIPSKHRAA